jgi:hypothetical protein
MTALREQWREISGFEEEVRETSTPKEDVAAVAPTASVVASNTFSTGRPNEDLEDLSTCKITAFT